MSVAATPHAALHPRPATRALAVLLALAACSGNATDTDPDPDTDTDAVEATGETGIGPLAFAVAPSVAHNTGPARLVWWVDATTTRPASLEVALDDGTEVRRIEIPGEPATVHHRMILGLHSDTTYTVTVTARTDDGQEAAATGLEISTQPLPFDFSEATVEVSQPERMEPGYTLFDANGYLFIMDHSGEIVWYVQHGGSTEVAKLPNGNLLMQRGRGGIHELDMAGNEVQSWSMRDHDIGTNVDELTHHHDLVSFPDGSFATLSVEERTIANYPTSETNPNAPRSPAQVVGDVVVEFARDGTVLQRYPLLDLIDPERIGYGSVDYHGFWDPYFGYPVMDWSHANALWYDPGRDQYVVSLRHQDAIVGISRSTGALDWILAPHANWNMARFASALLFPVQGAPEDFSWSYHQHGVEITPHGTVLVFDNGNFRASAFEPKTPPRSNYSRAVEYAIDPVAGTVELVWEFGAELDPQHYAHRMGDADWLPETGNILVAFTDPSGSDVPDARIVEVTHDQPAEVLFNMALPWASTNLYRASRIPSLY